MVIPSDDLATLMTLLREVSDDLHTTAQTMAEAQHAPAWVTTLEQRLDALVTRVQRLPEKPPASSARWWWGGILGLGLLVGGLGGWWSRGHYGLERQDIAMLGRLDHLLTQRYHTLPTSLRNTLDTVYTQAGFLAPGKRHGVRREVTSEPGR
jgi:hypothetical protein